MPSEPVLPLTEDEERVWRSLVRLMILMPRAVDEDLARRGGLSMTRYVVLMRLSEAPGRELRMSDLAGAAALSPSRMTRIIQAMIAQGLVVRVADADDARAARAQLTEAGLRRLQEAWPAHLAGVRALVLDHLDPADLPGLERVVGALLRGIEPAPPTDAPGG